jgi:flagellar hook-associated protein 2
MSVDVLSSLNTNGSGINIAELSENLATADVAPRKKLVTERIDTAELRMSGVERLRAQLEFLDESMQLVSTLNTRFASSNNAAVSVSLEDAAALKDGAVEVNVTRLAKPQVLEFSGYVAADEPIGAGALTVDFGSWSDDAPPVFSETASRAKTITFAAGSTLQDVAQALDSLDGVSAQIIDVGDGTFSLGVTSDTGRDNALRFTAGAGAAPALAALDFNADPAPFQVTQSGDAELSVNGISVTRSSNTIDDVVPGISITLNAPTTTAASVSTEIDTESSLQVFQGLVDVINATRSLVTSLTNRAATGEEDGGELAGETLPDTIMRRIEGILGSGVLGANGDMAYLAEFGVETTRTGSLVLNENTFLREFRANPDKFDALLKDSLTTSESGVTVSGRLGPDASGVYNLFRDPVTGAATLDGQSLKSFGQGADGNFLYSVESGPLAGTTISIADGVTDAEISVGRSIATQMRDYLDDVLSSGSTLDMSTKEYKSDFDENTEMLEALDEKYDMLYDRYLSRFTAMEQVVAQLNSTGDYLTNLVDAWNSDN